MRPSHTFEPDFAGDVGVAAMGPVATGGLGLSGCAAALAGGARSVLAEHPDWVVHVPAGPDCLVDLDTPEALEAARQALEGQESGEGS